MCNKFINSKLLGDDVKWNVGNVFNSTGKVGAA